MDYRVKYAEDELLGDRNWLLCNQHDDGVTLYIRRGARKLPDAEMEQVLEDAWAGFREMCRVIPEQRQALDISSATAAS